MLHVPMFSLGGLKGLSPIQLNRQNIGLAQAATKYGARWFGGGGKPPGLLINKSTNISPEQKKLMRTSWEEAQGGENQGRTAVITGDWSYQAIGIPPEDSQFLQTRQFGRTEIAAIFKVPAHMIGDTSKMSNNNAEQMNLGFVIDTLRPILMRYEAEIRRKLIPGQPELIVEFDVSERLRGDFKTTMDGLAVGKQWGILTTNDCLAQLGMNSAGPIGDVYWSPVNMQNSARLLDTESIEDQPIDTGPAPDPPGPKLLPAPASGEEDEEDKPAPKKEKKSILAQYERPYAMLFRDAMGRLINREKRELDVVTAIFEPVITSIVDHALIGIAGLDASTYITSALRSLSSRATKFIDRDVNGPEEFRRVVRSAYINVQRDKAAAIADEETQ